MTELKPCPFCGSHDMTMISNCIECDECHANITDDSLTEDELVQRWNTRVAGEE